MRIDVHAHHFPDRYVEHLGSVGHPDARNALLRASTAVSLDERLGLLDGLGIDLQVLSVAVLQPYLPRAADAVAAARLGNDLYAEVCAQYHGRFAAFGAVPLPHVDAAVAETERCLDTLGMVGITVGCTVNGQPLDDPAFEPFFAALDARAAVLFLHPVGLASGPLLEDYGLRWMVGAPVEDAAAALRLVLSGVTTRYRRLRLLVPHLGGFLPFLLQRLDDEADRESRTGVERLVEGLPSDHVRRFWFDTVNSHPPALRCACDSFGADRLMLGTDFPYLAGERLQRAVDYIARADLPQAERDAILGGNAQALLGLAARERG